MDHSAGHSPPQAAHRGDHDVELDIDNATHPYTAEEVLVMVEDGEKYNSALQELHSRRREAEAAQQYEDARALWLSIAKLKRDVDNARAEHLCNQFENSKHRMEDQQRTQAEELADLWDTKERLLREEIDQAFQNLELKGQQEMQDLETKTMASAKFQFRPSTKLLALKRRASALVWLQNYAEAQQAEAEYKRAEDQERSVHNQKMKVQLNILKDGLHRRLQEELKDLEDNKFRLLQEFAVARSKADHDLENAFHINVNSLKKRTMIMHNRLKTEVPARQQMGPRKTSRPSSPMRDSTMAPTTGRCTSPAPAGRASTSSPARRAVSPATTTPRRSPATTSTTPSARAAAAAAARAGTNGSPNVRASPAPASAVASTPPPSTRPPWGSSASTRSPRAALSSSAPPSTARAGSASGRASPRVASPSATRSPSSVAGPAGVRRPKSAAPSATMGARTSSPVRTGTNSPRAGTTNRTARPSATAVSRPTSTTNVAKPTPARTSSPARPIVHDMGKGNDVSPVWGTATPSVQVEEQQHRELQETAQQKQLEWIDYCIKIGTELSKSVGSGASTSELLDREMGRQQHQQWGPRTTR